MAKGDEPWLMRFSRPDQTGRRVREWARRYPTREAALEAAEREQGRGALASVEFSPVK